MLLGPNEIFPVIPHIEYLYRIRYDLPMTSVCFICLNAYKVFNSSSAAQIGGTEVQMGVIAQELAKDTQFDVSCVVGNFGQAKREQYGNLIVYSSFPLTTNIINVIKAPLLRLRLLVSIRPNIIISSPAGSEVGIACLYAHLFGKKFIFRTASDVDCNRKKAKNMNIFTRMLYEFGIRFADQIVVQHEGQRSDIQKYYGRDSTMIQNGYATPVPTVTTAFETPSSSILWVGSSRHVKRPDLLFTLARSLPQYRFTMILSRSGDIGIFRWSEEMARSISNIDFLGELSFNDVRARIANSTLVIGTSDYEGFPNIYVLAALSGVPVVSLRVNPDEYLTTHKAGVCVDGDMKTMRSEIIHYMEDSTYRSVISQNALLYASMQYTIESIIPRWISVIHTTSYSE